MADHDRPVNAAEAEDVPIRRVIARQRGGVRPPGIGRKGRRWASGVSRARHNLPHRGAARQSAALCGARPWHQQLPPADRPPGRGRVSRPRRLHPHRPAGRGRVAHRPAVRGRHGRTIEALRHCRNKLRPPRPAPDAADRHRSLPRRRQRRRVPRAGARASSGSSSRSSTAAPRRNWRSPAAPT